MSRNEPVRYTCPDIDECIKCLKEARSYVSSAFSTLEDIEDAIDDENPNGIPDLVRSAKRELKYAIDSIDLDRTLEELRNSNAALRDWGHGLRNEIEELERQM